MPVVLHHRYARFGQIVHFVLDVGVDSSLVVSLFLSSKPSMYGSKACVEYSIQAIVECRTTLLRHCLTQIGHRRSSVGQILRLVTESPTSQAGIRCAVEREKEQSLKLLTFLTKFTRQRK